MGDCVSGTGRTHPQLKMVHRPRRAHQHIPIVSRRSNPVHHRPTIFAPVDGRQINQQHLHAYDLLVGNIY